MPKGKILNTTPLALFAAGTLASVAYRVYKKSAAHRRRHVVAGKAAVPVYSPAVVVNNETVWVAGQIALGPGGVKAGLVGAGDAGKEAEQALANLKAVLEKAGSSIAQVSACCVYLTSMDDYQALNAAYKKVFTGSFPARACFAVVKLPFGARVEIEAVASIAGVARRVVPGPEGFPFSSAVVAGEKTAYVSGNVGVDPKTGKLVPGGVGAQFKQALTNLKGVVEKAGASMRSVNKVTIYLNDMADYQAINDVYKTFFTDRHPARACFAVAALPLGALVEVSCIASVGTVDREVVSGKTAAPVYSPAVIAGGSAVFVSGQIALGKDGRMVGGGDAGKEAQQALSNLKAVLSKAGSSLDDVAKVNVFMQDMADYGAFNEVYKTFFKSGQPPARAAVEVSKLPKGAKVEIECVAQR